MSRNQRGNGSVVEQMEEQTEVVEVKGNRTAFFHSAHPKIGTPSRVSYTIPGVSGNIVIFLSMFKDGIAPSTITFDCELVEPKAETGKQAKEEAAAFRLQERADKAQAKLVVQQEKAQAAAAKAQASLDAAKAKLVDVTT